MQIVRDHQHAPRSSQMPVIARAPPAREVDVLGSSAGQAGSTAARAPAGRAGAPRRRRTDRVSASGGAHPPSASAWTRRPGTPSRKRRPEGSAGRPQALGHVADRSPAPTHLTSGREQPARPAATSSCRPRWADQLTISPRDGGRRSKPRASPKSRYRAQKKQRAGCPPGAARSVSSSCAPHLKPRPAPASGRALAAALVAAPLLPRRPAVVVTVAAALACRRRQAGSRQAIVRGAGSPHTYNLKPSEARLLERAGRLRVGPRWRPSWKALDARGTPRIVT
jgi:hypothetical protein